MGKLVRNQLQTLKKVWFPSSQGSPTCTAAAKILDDPSPLGANDHHPYKVETKTRFENDCPLISKPI